MPIVSIIQQPIPNELKAAYRPISFIVRASRTDSNPLPPVVYCDIYVGGIFYKTQEKTQYLVLNSSNSDWKFDIQDACQEVLTKVLSANGNSSITVVPEAMKSIFCKFRSSGFDTSGFIVAEGTKPTQQTGRIASTPGSGTQSNTFFTVNSMLQHENNQNLAVHLNSYKANGVWATQTYPLSHRYNAYKVGANDSDMFPIIHLGPNALKSLVLNYKYKGQTGFSSSQHDIPSPCNININGLAITIFKQSPDVTYVIYHAAWTVTGDALSSYNKEYSLDNGASWHPVTIITLSDAGQLNYSLGAGTVNEAPQTHKLRITPVGAVGVGSCSAAVATYTYSPCISLGIAGTPVLPNGTVGVPYFYSFDLTGSAPFTIGGTVTDPSWMTIAVVGSSVQFTGTPTTAAAGIPVSFVLLNCSGATVTFSQTFTVAASTSLSVNMAIRNDSVAGIIATVIAAYTIITGTTPVLPSAQVQANHGAIGYNITVVLGGTLSGNQLQLIVNGSTRQTIAGISSSGSYTFPVTTILATDNLLIDLV